MPITFNTVTHPEDLKDLLRRDHTLNGAVLIGIEGQPIEIQARAMSVFDEPIPWSGSTRITGMARGAINEVLSRITGAFTKLEVPEPQVEILINLAPADLLKEGTWLDLPIAIIMLQAAGILPDLPDHKEGDFILAGEIGIHGEIRRIPGALSLAYLTRPGQNLIVPYGNEMECALITKKPGHEGSRVLGAATIEEVIEFFQGKRKLSTQAREGFKFQDVIPKHLDFGRIKGQARAKRAAVISAAGGHNLLLIGPPGEGKSLLANAIPGILPQLSDPEKVLLTKIYSACGELTNDGCAVTRRPMRLIHHTASKQAIIGGGSGLARPGEVTLAHLGVLFLDEIAEFSQSTLDTLRQPIEDGEVSISRVHATVRYPCRFTLVAAMNPCPCGYFGSDQCRCQEKEVKKYQKKLSGPILDRIDLQVELERLSIDERFAASEDNVSQKHREQVQKARSRQHNRFKDTEIPFNAAIPGGHVLELCNFSPDGQTAYKQVISENTITTRSMDRLAKVARTIADLAASETIEPVHIEEATTFVIGGMLRNTF